MGPQVVVHVAARRQPEPRLWHRVLKLPHVFNGPGLNVGALPCIDKLDFSIHFICPVRVSVWLAIITAQYHPAVLCANSLHLGGVVIAVNEDLAAAALRIDSALQYAVLFARLHDLQIRAALLRVDQSARRVPCPCTNNHVEVVLLNVHCAEIVYPYARENISSIIQKGGFPPLFLSPIDFHTIYQNELDKRKND